MKTKILYIVFLLLSPLTFTQNVDCLDGIDIIEYPDVDANFPGDAKTMQKFISENFQLPTEYAKISLSGKIYLSFIVMADGSITCVKVDRGIDEKLDEIAKNLILSMPDWIPAEFQGMKVNTKIRLPIIINLD